MTDRVKPMPLGVRLGAGGWQTAPSVLVWPVLVWRGYAIHGAQSSADPASS